MLSTTRRRVVVAVGLMVMGCVAGSAMVAAQSTFLRVIGGTLGCVLAGVAFRQRSRLRIGVLRDGALRAERSDAILRWVLIGSIPFASILIASGHLIPGLAFVLWCAIPLLTRLRAGSSKVPVVVKLALLSVAVSLGRVRDRDAIIVLISVTLLVAAISWRPGSSANFQMVVCALIDSIGAYLIINVLAYFAGHGSPAAAARADGAIGAGGILAVRAYFPFSIAVTTPSAMAACFLVGILALPTHSPGQRAWRWTAGSAAWFVLLASDGRLALISMGVVGTLVFISPGALRRIAPVLAVIGLCLPIWWGSTTSLVKPVATAFSGSAIFNRQGTQGSFASLNNRTNIWKVVTEPVTPTPTAERFFGWGEHGQVASRLYESFGRVAGNLLIDSQKITAHSSLYQQYIDQGLLGVAVLLGLLLWPLAALRRLTVERDRETLTGATAVASMIVLLAFSGATDSLLATNQESRFLLFLLATVVVAAGSNQTRARIGRDKKPTPSRN